MTDPAQTGPIRKKANPLRRTRAPLLPPDARSRAAHLLTAAAAEGHFDLPCCSGCGRFVWPVAEACPECLCEIATAPAPRGARVISITTAEVPADTYFRERAPWRVGLVSMDCGPQAIVHMHPDAAPGQTVQLTLMLDRAGQAVLHAAPKGADLQADPQYHEMTANPAARRVLITDARHVAALPLARALIDAGAHSVHLGVPEPWKPLVDRPRFEAIKGVHLVALDVNSERSVGDLAADLAGKVEILINTADLPRPGGLLSPTAQGYAREMSDVVVQGLLRLARCFGPAMAGRGADGPRGAAAWVNVLSVFARATPPDWAGYGAAHASALALSRVLRADLGAGGVRVVTVLTGPTEDDWFQTMAPPRVTGAALAKAIVQALREGLEDVVVGDVARDLVARLEENPKAVERELAKGSLS